MLLNISKGEQKISLDSLVYVTIDPKVLYELQQYVAHFETEVSGCGLVDKIVHKDEEGKYLSTEFRIAEVLLPEKQKNSAVGTEIDSTMLQDLMYELLQKGVDTNRLKLHWHSHADMNVFHSTTDEENYEDLNNGDFLVSLVLNKANDVLASVHIYRDILLDIDNVPLYVYSDVVDTELSMKIKDNIDKLEAHTKTLQAITQPLSTWYSRKNWEKVHACDKKKGKNKHKESRVAEDELEEFDKSAVEKFELCPGIDCGHCMEVYQCANYFTTVYGCENKQEYELQYEGYQY